jgi:ketosteroid isomerase-like protein
MHSPEAAEAAFYAAFAATDPDAMRAVWATGHDVACIHPAGAPISGYDAVMASWRDILGGDSSFELAFEPISRSQSPTLMVSTVYERFRPAGAAGEAAPVLATNVYRLVDGLWKMVLHHASPVAAPSRPRVQPAPTRH